MKKSGTIHSSGFTLLEILVAMSIITIVLSTLFVTFKDTLENMNYVESQSDIYQMAHIALDRMQEDLECSIILAKKDETSEEGTDESLIDVFSGKNEEINDRDADTVSFLSTMHLSLNDGNAYSGLARITFYIEEIEDEEGLVLYRSDTPEREQAPEEKTGGVILCKNIHSFDLSYYDSDGDKFESWDSSEGEVKNRLPARVSIRLAFIDISNPETPYQFETGVALPLADSLYGDDS